MHFPLRSPVLGLAALLLIAPLGALVGGCSADADPEVEGPMVTATGPREATDPTGPSGSDGSTASGVPDAVTAVCTPYTLMVEAITDAAGHSRDPEEVAAEIAPVMKTFAAQVPDLEPPPGMSATTWAAIEALAAKITALPDRPSNAELEAVEAGLTAEQRDALKDAFAWFRATCA